jgi:transcriptional regulator with PAS, ATPase and Fis domain
MRGGDETRTVETKEGDGYVLFVSTASHVECVQLPQKPQIVIGRGAGCDIVVPDDSVSREHARIHLGERLSIRDLGSKNGSRVAGERLGQDEWAPIAVGAVFELGSVTFVLQRPSGIGAGARAAASRVPADAIVDDPTMRRLYALLDIVAPSPLAVLVLGETGVGKEVFARALHDRSPRRAGPFVPIHCAAMPESMLEAELFGYEKGAFTGAAQAKPGLFEAAHGGTAFLDEVGEIPFATQAKLLRVLETGEVRRVGSVAPKKVDARIVAATNRDLRALIGEERFRADLYFRLNGITMTLPSLRERKAEIGPLARAFARRAADSMKKPAPELAPDAVALLEAYAWPGNVRELRNVVERAVLLAPNRTIVAADLEAAAPEAFGAEAPAIAASSRDPAALRAQLHDAEKQQIAHALAKTGGNQSRAAELLGMSRYALMHRMEVFGLVRPRKKRR